MTACQIAARSAPGRARTLGGQGGRGEGVRGGREDEIGSDGDPDPREVVAGGFARRRGGGLQASGWLHALPGEHKVVQPAASAKSLDSRAFADGDRQRKLDGRKLQWTRCGPGRCRSVRPSPSQA